MSGMIRLTSSEDGSDVWIRQEKIVYMAQKREHTDIFLDQDESAYTVAESPVEVLESIPYTPKWIPRVPT